MNDTDPDAIEAVGASFGRLIGALHANGVITDERRDGIAETIGRTSTSRATSASAIGGDP